MNIKFALIANVPIIFYLQIFECLFVFNRRTNKIGRGKGGGFDIGPMVHGASTSLEIYATKYIFLSSMQALL